MQLGVMQAMFWCFSGSNSIKIPMVMVLAWGSGSGPRLGYGSL
jgi:hypothetical protein